jgi:coenzyme F420-0:L-glutamate ligase/coenzyme F420-1:gamma-L-glutamate ligase
MVSYSVTAIDGMPMVRAGDDLAALIVRGLQHTGLELKDRDIVVVCQKVVSKSEGRLVDLKDVEPSAFAKNLGAKWEKDPRAVEIVLRQTNRIVRNDHGVIIVETGPGWVCANAGVDESNSPADDVAILLPVDPDASAARIRADLKRLCGVQVAVLITDTFGRPWRDGLTEVCLGIAGMNPILDLRGTTDLGGRELHHTVVATADELACAAGLLMQKASATPAVVIRGFEYQPFDGSAKVLIRPPEADLFR